MTSDKTKAIIRRQIKHWEYIVESWGWKFTVYLCDNNNDMPEGYDKSTAAVTFASPEYLQASVYFDVATLSKETPDSIEEIVVHELTHMILSPLWVQHTRESNELCTTMVSRLLKGLRK